MLNGVSEEDAALFGRISAKSGMKIVVTQGVESNPSTASGPPPFTQGRLKQSAESKPAWYDGKNTVYVDADADRVSVFSGLLGHEMWHKMFKSGKARRIMMQAYRRLDKATRAEVEKAYTADSERRGFDKKKTKEVNREEVAAAYAEELFNDPEVWDFILSEEASLADRTLKFFEKAEKRYSFAEEMPKAARKWLAKYKMLFDQVATYNKGRSAAENAVASDTVRRIERIGRIVESGESAEFRTQNAELDDGSRKAIVKPFKDENGKTYNNAVLLDTNFFDGLSPRNWGTKLKEYVENRSKTAPFIFQITDESGAKQDLVFAKKSDYVKKDSGSYHKALSELYETSDNISKLSTIHIDEIIEISEENNPYYSSENSHGWFDKHGWLHRNANVINAKTGAIYNVTIDIAKTEDGRTVLYATKGKIKKVGQAKVSSLKVRGSTPYSNSAISIHESFPKSNSFDKKTSKDFKNDAENGKNVDDGSRSALKKKVIVNIEPNPELDDLILNSDKNRADVIRLYLINKYQGEIFNLSDGKQAIMDKSDAKELAHNASSERTKQLGNLKKLVEEARYDHSALNVEHNKFVNFYYYTVTAKYRNTEADLWINVGQAKNNGINHIYSITNKKEDAPTKSGVGGPVGNHLQNASSNNSIPDSVEKSNSFGEKSSKNVDDGTRFALKKSDKEFRDEVKAKADEKVKKARAKAEAKYEKKTETAKASLRRL